MGWDFKLVDNGDRLFAAPMQDLMVSVERVRLEIDDDIIEFHTWTVSGGRPHQMVRIGNCYKQEDAIAKVRAAVDDYVNRNGRV